MPELQPMSRFQRRGSTPSGTFLPFLFANASMEWLIVPHLDVAPVFICSCGDSIQVRKLLKWLKDSPERNCFYQHLEVVRFASLSLTWKLQGSQPLLSKEWCRLILDQGISDPIWTSSCLIRKGLGQIPSLSIIFGLSRSKTQCLIRPATLISSVHSLLSCAGGGTTNQF